MFVVDHHTAAALRYPTHRRLDFAVDLILDINIPGLPILL